MLRLPLLLLLLLGFVFVSIAQPANDDCSNAVTLTVNPTNTCTGINGILQNATSSMPPCTGSFSNDVWYKFVATGASAVVSLMVDFNQPIIEVFSGSCGSLTSIACFEPTVIATKTRAQITNLVSGDTYYLRIYSKVAPSPTLYFFTICMYTPLVNDDCSGALTVPVNTGTNWNLYVAGNNTDASPSPGSVCPANNTGDTWYKFVAQDSVHLFYVLLSKQTAPTPGATMEIYAGNCNGLTLVPAIQADNSPVQACVPAFSSSGYYKLQNLVAGNTYYIRVMQNLAAVTWTRTDSFYVKVSNVPSNDACAGAIDIPVNNGIVRALKISSDLKNASNVTGVPRSCPANNDIWYKFTATATRHVVSLQNFSDIDAISSRFEVYRNSCSNLQTIVCSPAPTISKKWRFANLTGLTIGEVYYIRLFQDNAYFYNATEQLFDLAVTTPPATAPNDDCATATALPLNDFIATTSTGATSSVVTPSCYSGSDIWYVFTAPFDGNAQLGIDYGGLGGNAQIYSGTCAGLTSVICRVGSTLPAIIDFPVQAGQTYYVRMGASGNYAAGFNWIAPLPVRLTSVNATVIDNQSINISWKTVEESNIDYYEVQRSTDGANFKGIGKVMSNNSALPATYQLEDRSPLSGRNFYRLKIVNRDGKIEYSKIVNAAFKGKFTDNLQVYHSANTLITSNNTNQVKNVIYNAYNAQGQLLFTRNKTLMPGNNTMEVPAVFGAGNLYFIKINAGDKELKTFNIMW